MRWVYPPRRAGQGQPADRSVVGGPSSGVKKRGKKRVPTTDDGPLTTDPLLPAVLAAPADDLPRLVYADWLDERGDAARAEFIRVQLALAAGRPADRVREQTLLAAHSVAWLAPLHAHGAPLFGRGTHGQFRRGFVEVVWMPAAAFVRRAEKLFAAAPVAELRVTRATPAELAALLAAPAARRLAVLELVSRPAGELARLIEASPAVAGLRRLRLPACGLDDAAALRLADLPFDWPLEELDVRQNPITRVGADILRARYGKDVVRAD